VHPVTCVERSDHIQATSPSVSLLPRLFFDPFLIDVKCRHITNRHLSDSRPLKRVAFRLKTSLLRLLALGWILLAVRAEAATNKGRFSAEELAQGFSNATVLARPRDSDDAAASAAEVRDGIAVRQRFPRFGNLRVLRVPAGETVGQMISRLRATGRYAYVEPDRLIHAHAQPNDTSFAQQWSLNNTGQNGADIHAVAAWDVTHDATNIIVAVVDSGIRLTHNDLKDNLWTQTGTNVHGIRATEGNGSTTSNPDDDDGHGTHVAGIIGASGNNSLGISGVAWKTQLMALKFITADGAGSTADSIACINYAIANGASVINASWGSDSYSSAEFDAIKSARDHGVIFVASAGNDGLLNDTNEDYPSNYPLDNIVTVAATTRTDTLASYSNYGSGLVDLGAPGSEIYSTYKDSDSAYAIASGTSMAAPHVSGAIALLKATYPGEGYRQLINRLLRGTSRLPALSGKVQTGGRLNLAQALSASATTNNRPFNDNFSERAVASGANVRVRSNNEGATAEAGENNHAGVTGNTSLWWTWTAPANSQVVFDTNGSAYDTALAIYTGTTVSTLQAVASNDNAPGTTTSRVLVNVVGGTTYQIAVSGRNNAAGYTSLRIGTVPANDDLANAQLLTGVSLRADGTLLNASKESGEKDPTSSAAGHSIWFKWVAPKSGSFILSAFATSVDTIAAVYTGSGSVGNLTLVAAQDDAPTNSANSDALVPFTASSGTTYYFSIDHGTRDGTLGGDFILTLTDAAWEYSTNDEVTSSPAVGSDGTIYFGAGSDDKNDKNIYAVTSSGTKKWSVSTGESGIIGASPAIAPDGTVYVGGTDKVLYALNGATGARKWSFSAATPISSTPAIGSDGTVYFRDDTKLYALSSSGSSRWSFDLTGSTDGTYCSPAIGTDGTIYVGTNGGAFYAVKDNGASASQKWKYTADEAIFTSPAIAADGTIYFATLNGTVYALTDGGGSATRKWSWTAPGNSSITSSIALAADGTLYFAAYDHKLYALSSAGSQKWACPLGDEVRASSAAVGADGTIYVGCYDGQIYAVSSGGALQRVYTTAKTIRSSAVIANNRLYIGSADAKLYAFDIGQSAGTSSWPMFQQNAGHTGRYSANAVVISSQPQSKTVVAGMSTSLSVGATGSGLAYQWYKNGSAIAGATSSTYTISIVSAGDAGTYTVVISNATDSITSSGATLSVLPVGSATTSFANIATRAFCSTGNKVTIGGFVISGSASKHVLVRAVGPTLVKQGIGAAEVLADPTIEVYSGASVIATNDNWGDNGNAAEITSTSKQIGATTLDTADTKSSALLLTLPPGVYSFVVNGKSGTSGIVLLEVYDADGGVGTKFVNIASRAYATTGNGVAIGGFVISGNASKNVLIRAIGPTLTKQGIETGEVLMDPTIELHQGAPVLASNDNWGTNANAAEISSTASRIGASPIDNADTTSSALLLNLQPGVYSFIASGKSGSSGIVLVEVYDAD
jgi:outer membrane protein assembly factor BamB